MGETCRNYFSVGGCSETATRMKASPHWSGGCSETATRKALYDHMMQTLHVPARFAVTFHDYEGEMIVSAKSHSAAKYKAYLQCETDEPFGDFAKGIKSVKIHRRVINPQLAESS